MKVSSTIGSCLDPFIEWIKGEAKILNKHARDIFLIPMISTLLFASVCLAQNINPSNGKNNLFLLSICSHFSFNNGLMCYLRCHQPRQLFRATLNSIKSDIDFIFFLGLGIGIESSTSFCLIIPVQPGNGIDTNYIAATELTGVSACTSSVPVGK